MSKKTIVNEIIGKLKKLGVAKYGCHNLDIELPNGDKLGWLGYTQVMVSAKINGSLFRNKRFPLYSKEIDADMLNLISSRL
jgi:hypothetical protein